jgi:hypothetical protein
MPETNDDDRPLRVCDLCGGVDPDPRHVIAGNREAFNPPDQEIVQKVLDAAPADQQAALVAALMDVTSQDRHMDCCREAGCPDGTCDVVTAGAETKRGDELREYILSNAERD